MHDYLLDVMYLGACHNLKSFGRHELLERSSSWHDSVWFGSAGWKLENNNKNNNVLF